MLSNDSTEHRLKDLKRFQFWMLVAVTAGGIGFVCGVAGLILRLYIGTTCS